jgi:hypothetical protein
VRAGYLDISIDVCDITAAVDAGNWTTAAEIYENGKNSVRGDGSLRTFLGELEGGARGGGGGRRRRARARRARAGGGPCD